MRGEGMSSMTNETVKTYGFVRKADVERLLGRSLPLLFMDLLSFLIIGLIAGWIADMLVKGSSFGLIGHIIIGVIGAFIGGFIFRALGIDAYGLLGSIVMAVIGAVVLLLIIQAFNKRRVV